jgi:hypothetical protein
MAQRREPEDLPNAAKNEPNHIALIIAKSFFVLGSSAKGTSFAS